MKTQVPQVKFYADKKQARLVFGLLIKRLKEKGPPYNSALVPQTDVFFPNNLEKGSRGHAVFLFLLCLWMRGGAESDTTAFFLKEMHQERPDLFDPFLYRDRDYKSAIAEITRALTEYKLGQRVDENAPAWVYNMKKLAKFWNGDPRRIMDDKPNFKTLAKRIIGRTANKEKVFELEDNPHGFRFFREKMVAMIAYFLMDAKLVPMFYTPVPVDFHVLRLLVANRIIKIHGKSAKESIGVDFMKSQVLKEARFITEWYCRKYKISPIALCDSLWLLSRNFCRSNPGNSGYVRDLKRKTDIQNKKRASDKHHTFNFEVEEISFDQKNIDADEVSGRKRYSGLKWKEDEIWNQTRINRFEKSCGLCPVRTTCRFNISAGAYYVGGKLLPERFRLEPPNNQSHFLDYDDFTGTFVAKVDPQVRFTEVHMEHQGLLEL